MKQELWLVCAAPEVAKWTVGESDEEEEESRNEGDEEQRRFDEDQQHAYMVEEALVDEEDEQTYDVEDDPARDGRERAGTLTAVASQAQSHSSTTGLPTPALEAAAAWGQSDATGWGD